MNTTNKYYSSFHLNVYTCIYSIYIWNSINISDFSRACYQPRVYFFLSLLLLFQRGCFSSLSSSSAAARSVCVYMFSDPVSLFAFGARFNLSSCFLRWDGSRKKIFAPYTQNFQTKCEYKYSFVIFWVLKIKKKIVEKEQHPIYWADRKTHKHKHPDTI